MSRYEVTAIDPSHKVIVGWDHPLMTFFAQVKDGEKFILWQGCSSRQLYEVEDLIRVVRRYAIITPELAAQLYGDKDEGR